MTIKDVTTFLEQKFPLYLQEDFDNCGVQCGDVRQEITGAMVCFEMSEQVIDEAKRLIDACAPGGGFIFETSCGIDLAKKENLEALRDTVRTYGKR